MHSVTKFTGKAALNYSYNNNDFLICLSPSPFFFKQRRILLWSFHFPRFFAPEKTMMVQLLRLVNDFQRELTASPVYLSHVFHHITGEIVSVLFMLFYKVMLPLTISLCECIFLFPGVIYFPWDLTEFVSSTLFFSLWETHQYFWFLWTPCRETQASQWTLLLIYGWKAEKHPSELLQFLGKSMGDTAADPSRPLEHK